MTPLSDNSGFLGIPNILQGHPSFGGFPKGSLKTIQKMLTYNSGLTFVFFSPYDACAFG